MKLSRLIPVLIGSLAIWPVGLSFAQLEPESPSNTSQSQLESPFTSLQFTPPQLPDRGRPGGRSEGGASRGGCNVMDGQPHITALIPTADVASLTAQAKPSLWFYVPYPLTETPLEFVLQDENNNTLYRDTITTDSSATISETTVEQGIVQITLPDTAPDLESGSAYRWFFMAYCEPDSPSFVEGWIERTALSPSLSAAIASATPREQALLYAQNGFWSETLTLVGESYRENIESSEYQEAWESLLLSVELDYLVEQPLASCCSFE